MNTTIKQAQEVIVHLENFYQELENMTPEQLNVMRQLAEQAVRQIKFLEKRLQTRLNRAIFQKMLETADEDYKGYLTNYFAYSGKEDRGYLSLTQFRNKMERLDQLYKEWKHGERPPKELLELEKELCI